MKTNAFPGLKSNKSFLNNFLKNSLLKNNQGQLAIESILLMTVLLGAFLVVTNYFRDKKLISNLVRKPIQSVAIMTGYGVWKSEGGGCKVPGKTRVSLGKCHPNAIARSLSSAPQ